jgi:hypothetical protein
VDGGAGAGITGSGFRIWAEAFKTTTRLIAASDTSVRNFLIFIFFHRVVCDLATVNAGRHSSGQTKAYGADGGFANGV